MALALAAAALGGLGTAGWVHKHQTRDLTTVQKCGKVVGSGAAATLFVLGMALLAVKINQAIWKDHLYSAKAFATLKKCALIAGGITIVALLLFVLAKAAERCKRNDGDGEYAAVGDDDLIQPMYTA